MDELATSTSNTFSIDALLKLAKIPDNKAPSIKEFLVWANLDQETIGCLTVESLVWWVERYNKKKKKDLELGFYAVKIVESATVWTKRKAAPLVDEVRNLNITEEPKTFVKEVPEEPLFLDHQSVHKHWRNKTKNRLVKMQLYPVENNKKITTTERDEAVKTITTKYNSLTEILYGAQGPNSIFEVISHQLFEDSKYAGLLRIKAARYLKQQAATYKDYVLDNFELYCKQMKNSQRPGDNLVLHALAELYSCSINIFVPEDNRIYYIESSGFGEKPVVLLAKEHDCYFSIRIPSTANVEHLMKFIVVNTATEQVNWTIQINRTKNHYLRELALGFILDLEKYTDQGELEKDCVSTYIAESENLKKSVTEPLPNSTPPSQASFDCQRLADPETKLTPEERSLIYWAESLYHIRSVHSLQSQTELGLTGAVLSHIYDSFWNRYCEGEGVIWHRNKDMRNLLYEKVPWSFFCDAAIQMQFKITVHGQNIPLDTTETMAVFEDKATAGQRKEDRAKLAETSRYIHDTIRKRHQVLNDTDLEGIIIPSVHTAGSMVDFYLLKWSGKGENCYPFYHVAEYDISTQNAFELACQRMWNILDTLKNNVKIIQQAYSRSSKQPKQLEKHEYVLRVHRDGPPGSSMLKKTSSQSGGSNRTSNTPTKSNNNNNAVDSEAMQQSITEHGHTVLETLSSGNNSTVFVCFETRQKEIIKVSKSTHELSILSKINGQHNIVKLLGHFDIHMSSHKFTALVLPHMEDVHVTSELQLKIFATQLIDAMVFLHKSGIYHRDIKRTNVVFDGKQLHLIDFDLAHQMDTNRRPQGRVGTEGYMAPEVQEGLESGYPADTWSAAVVIVEEFFWWKQGEVGSLYVRQRAMSEVLEHFQQLCNTKMLEKAFQLIARMVELDPKKRITDEEILQHPFLIKPAKRQVIPDKENLPPNSDNLKKKSTNEITKVAWIDTK